MLNYKSVLNTNRHSIVDHEFIENNSYGQLKTTTRAT